MYRNQGFSSKIKRFYIFISPIIGTILVAAVLFGGYYYEKNGREMFFYHNIYVLNEDVQRGTEIEEHMLVELLVEETKLVDQVITDKNQIIGLSSKQYIPKLAQLHPLFFDLDTLITNEDTFIMKLPNEWVFSAPNTLRRKDKAYFFEVTKENQAELNHLQKEEDDIDLYDVEKSHEIKTAINQSKWIMNTTVAYVKDNANKEVITVSAEDRIDGTSSISHIEVVMTKEKMDVLSEAIDRGSKLIIMYSEGEG